MKPEFTAKKYVPEAPTEKMKNAQARTIIAASCAGSLLLRLRACQRN